MEDLPRGQKLEYIYKFIMETSEKFYEENPELRSTFLLFEEKKVKVGEISQTTYIVGEQNAYLG